MARSNMPSKNSKKSNPIVTRLSFECSGGATNYIDCALALACVNRKMFRQGLYYYINSIEVYNNEQGVVDILTLPDTWVTRNAHQRGEKLFDKMNAMVDEISSVGRPAYHDFKVWMNNLHRTTGNVLPSMYTVNAVHAALVADEWQMSQFTSADDDGDPIQDADEFYVHMLGDHAGTSNDWASVGLIKSYADSRITVAATAPDSGPIDITDPLINVFDFSSEEQMNDIIHNLLGHNDSPPYNYDLYVGEVDESLQHVARVGTEVGLGRVGRASGFCAPMGLICVDPHSGTSTNFRVVVNIAAGSYNGVYAERA